MALSLYLLLLLMTQSVSAVNKEIHYMYHIHSLHLNPLRNASLSYIEQTAAILLDGKQINYYSAGKTMASAQRDKSWRTKNRMNAEKGMLKNEFEGFNDLLEINFNDAHHFIKRTGCVIEGSSEEDVTLLKSTAEYRLNGKTILYFSIDMNQWEALNKTFLPVKTRWDRFSLLNKITKEYLQRGCSEKLLQYLGAKDRNEISDSQILTFFTENVGDSPQSPGSTWSLTPIVLLSILVLICYMLHQRRRHGVCAICSLSGAICWCLSHFKKSRRRRPLGTHASAEDLSAEDDESDDDDDDDDDDYAVLERNDGAD